MIRIIVITLVVIAVVIALFVFTLLQSIASYAAYWENLANLPKLPNSVTYVVLGDSTGQGIGALPVSQSYPSQVAARIKQTTNRPVYILNLSKSGAKIDDVLQRQLPELKRLGITPDVLTIEIGANDAPILNTEQFRDQMDHVMRQLPANSILSDLPYFGGFTQLPTFGNGQAERNVEAANTIMYELAKTHSIALAPLHKETKTDNRFPWRYAIDYYHPNNFGYQSWTAVFWQEIVNRNLTKTGTVR